MPTFLKDDALAKLERSLAYVMIDLVFDWIGGITEFILVLYVAWSWLKGYAHFDFIFWLKAIVVTVALLSIGDLKDQLFAWAGIAPPDYRRWFGPKQSWAAIGLSMRCILEAQKRAGRIRARGIRVDELLKENIGHAEALDEQIWEQIWASHDAGNVNEWADRGRWILVLPAAIASYLAVQILIVLVGLMAGAGHVLTQFLGAVLCPVCFVGTGAVTAPKNQHTTSVCLTIVVAIYSTAVATWAIIDKLETKMGLAWLIICAFVGIVGSIAVCHAFHEDEKRNLGTVQ